MREATGNIWHYIPVADAICITTNGTVTKEGHAVMGRGVALQAKKRWPRAEKKLGRLIRRNGNVVQKLIRFRKVWDERTHFWTLVSFPVKHGWWEEAELSLIRSSASALMEMVEREQWTRVFIPRPGCGNGKLRWSVVKPIVEDIFDGRITVVYEEGHE